MKLVNIAEICFIQPTRKVYMSDHLRTSVTFPVKTIDPVSTIGAGDNFNAGIVYSLYRHNIGYHDLENLI